MMVTGNVTIVARNYLEEHQSDEIGGAGSSPARRFAPAGRRTTAWSDEHGQRRCFRYLGVEVHDVLTIAEQIDI